MISSSRACWRASRRGLMSGPLRRYLHILWCRMAAPMGDKLSLMPQCSARLVSNQNGQLTCASMPPTCTEQSLDVCSSATAPPTRTR
eukprot:scaffold6227_cov417-Prasinococcus_capsulatus_cf.AAC.2